MLKLGVNIDHVATVRQARGTAYPDVPEAARLCAEAGAHGITVHLREDRRHVQDADVYALKRDNVLPLNLEMALAEEIVAIALDVQPDEVCIVPEKRQELTTEGGLDVVGGMERVKDVVQRIQDRGTAVSLFIEPDKDQVEASAEAGATIIELHTGTYCEAIPERELVELERLILGAEAAHDAGLKVNAGHGINMDNIDRILQIPHLDTLNIGHSIVARALFVGLQDAVKEMIQAMSRYGES